MSVFEPASATADDAMSYIRFNPGKPVQLTVDDSVTYIRPGFMYRLEPGSNPMISVKVDNLVITRFRPVTFEGYFEIPPVSTGTHIIQVSCSGNSGQIFMKLPASVSCNENHYNLRQAFRLDPGQSLTLPFHKPSWDATGLNILAYRHPDSPNPVSLRVEGSTMSGSVTRPIAAPTQPLIRFTGNPSPGPAQVLTRSGQTLTSPERFHYRMQDDQKPDTYTVTIESQTDTPVFPVLHHDIRCRTTVVKNVLRAGLCALGVLWTQSALNLQQVEAGIRKTIAGTLNAAQSHTATDLYRIPTEGELAAFEAMFVDVLIAHETGDNARLQAMIPIAEKLGFTIETVQGKPGKSEAGITVIREPETIRRGGGIYFIARSTDLSRPAVIECPHARSDAFTGQLGLDVFLQGKSAALFCSSMRRNTPIFGKDSPATKTTPALTDSDSKPAINQPNGDDQEDAGGEDSVLEAVDEAGMSAYSEADPAHQDHSFFQSAHKAWMQRHPSSLIIQIHGFKNTGGLDRKFDLIVSDGTNPVKTPGFLLETERLLKQCYPTTTIGLFGRDTPIFGAVTNVQGQYMNRFSAGFFLHLEIERTFRETLKKNSSSRLGFATCINRLIQAYEKM